MFIKNFDCEESLYNKAIYGVDFPCIHTVLYNFIDGDFFQKFTSQYRIDLSDFFLTCTKFCHYSCYLQSKFDEGFKKIESRIGTYFLQKYNFIEDQNIIIELAKQFLQCFTYSLPEFIDVNLHQYSDNYFLKDLDNERFEFPRQHNKSESVKIDIEEIDTFLCKNDSECAILIKKKYYETQYEIRKMYPEMIEEGDSICFKCFMDFIYPKNDANDITKITGILAIFKMKCWKMADKKARNNKFFK